MVTKNLFIISIPSGAIKSRIVSKLPDGTRREISIPSGAIKSGNKIYTYRSGTISIPSGAIKSFAKPSPILDTELNFNSFWCD